MFFQINLPKDRKNHPISLVPKTDSTCSVLAHQSSHWYFQQRIYVFREHSLTSVVISQVNVPQLNKITEDTRCIASNGKYLFATVI